MQKTKISIYLTILRIHNLEEKIEFYHNQILSSSIDNEKKQIYSQNMDLLLEVSIDLRKRLSADMFLLELKPVHYYSLEPIDLSVPVYEFEGVRFLGLPIFYNGPREKILISKLPKFLSESDCKKLYNICLEYFCNNGVKDKEDEFLLKQLKGTYEGTLFRE